MKVQHTATLHESSVIALAQDALPLSRSYSPRKAPVPLSVTRAHPLAVAAAQAVQRPGTRLVVVSEYEVWVVNR